MENCFIYDWLTVSFKNDVDVDCLIHVLGLTSLPWDFQESGSRLKYGHRISYDGISTKELKIPEKIKTGHKKKLQSSSESLKHNIADTNEEQTRSQCTTLSSWPMCCTYHSTI